ncbi:ABC-type branched-chain amino acid transport systems, ATPase component [Desulfurococcaceae archaeon AG1]|jgi:branched-chain amino acid transport system ATP-binding protein|nr:ABC-type branched-chain amino acid transport systems, ATPase component [Desulfurococcaceae archaeon AG1]
MVRELLEVRGLRCQQGNMVNVEKADLVVYEKESVVVLGPNGSGKTALLKAIAGSLKPSSGSILYRGIDITSKSLHERISMGIRYIPDRDAAFRNLTVEDNLKLVKKDYDISLFPVLEKRLKVKAGYLSGGEYKILSLAMAYNSDAKLLLIDEPSSGLFLRMKVEIAEILKGMMRKGITMLIAEQDSEMAKLAGDRIYIMESGILREPREDDLYLL